MYQRRTVIAGCALALVAALSAGCQSPGRAERNAAAVASPTAVASVASDASPTRAAMSTAASTATPTTTTTPTATPTPTPSATSPGGGAQTPAGSASQPGGSTTRAAAQAAPAAAAPLGSAAPRRPAANAASAGFAPPPPRYTVAPPNSGGVARMVAPKFGIDHYIDVLGIIDNQMESPDHDGSYAVGWYPIFGAPGVPGNAVFSAHETWDHLQGPFYYMYTAQIGDRISIDMADGRRFTYEVISTARYTVDTIPMVDVLYPSTRGADEQWITLITCGGEIVYGADGFGDYIDRDIVAARRIS